MGLRFVQKTEYEHVDPYALQWTESLALGGKRGDEDPSLACFRPLRCGPLAVASTFVRQQSKALRHLTERSQHANSLRGRGGVDEVGHLCASDSIVYLFWVAHPFDKLLRGRSIAQQISEDLLRNLEKELAFFVLRRLEQRHRDCVRF